MKFRQSSIGHFRTFGIDIDWCSYLSDRHEIGNRLKIIDQKSIVLFSPFGFVLGSRTTKEGHVETRLFQPPDICIAKLSPDIHISDILLQRGFLCLQQDLLFLHLFELAYQFQSFGFRQFTCRSKGHPFRLGIQALTIANRRTYLFPFGQQSL